MTQHEISTILQALARLEVKVEALSTDDAKASAIAADLEQRMRSVEKTRATLIGMALVLGSTAGALARGLWGG